MFWNNHGVSHIRAECRKVDTYLGMYVWAKVVSEQTAKVAVFHSQFWIILVGVYRSQFFFFIKFKGPVLLLDHLSEFRVKLGDYVLEISIHLFKLGSGSKTTWFIQVWILVTLYMRDIITNCSLLLNNVSDMFDVHFWVIFCVHHICC